MDDCLRLELAEGAINQLVVRQVPFPERNLQAEVILERQQSLGHSVNRRGAPRSHLMYPPSPKERVHARDLVPPSRQVLGE